MKKLFAIFVLCFVAHIFPLAAQDAPLATIESPQTRVEPLLIKGLQNHQTFMVEVADTPPAMARGLMGREKLEDGTGMIFVFNPPQQISMWMKDTLIPLDMVFVNEKNRVFRFRYGKPMDETPIMSNGITKAVIELPEGTIKKHNIRIGDYVSSPALGLKSVN